MRVKQKNNDSRLQKDKDDLVQKKQIEKKLAMFEFEEKQQKMEERYKYHDTLNAQIRMQERMDREFASHSQNEKKL